MVLDGLRSLIGRQTAEEYIAELDEDTEVDVGVTAGVDRYTGLFNSIHRPLDEATVYAEIDDGEDPYREEIGTFLLETNGAYFSEEMEQEHAELEDAADDIIDDWTAMLDERGLEYDRE